MVTEMERGQSRGRISKMYPNGAHTSILSKVSVEARTEGTNGRTDFLGPESA